MDFDDYQSRASATDDTSGEDRVFNLMYLSMGLAGESGEVVEKIKKIIRNDNAEVSDETKNLLKKEMGDVLWYLSQMAKALAIPFNEVAQANLDKLVDRKKRGVLKSEGDSR